MFTIVPSHAFNTPCCNSHRTTSRTHTSDHCWHGYCVNILHVFCESKPSSAKHIKFGIKTVQNMSEQYSYFLRSAWCQLVCKIKSTLLYAKSKAIRFQLISEINPRISILMFLLSFFGTYKTIFVSDDANWAVIGILILKFHFTEYFSLENISKLTFQLKIDSHHFQTCVNELKLFDEVRVVCGNMQNSICDKQNFELIKSVDHFILFSSNSPKPEFVHILKFKLINHGTGSQMGQIFYFWKCFCGWKIFRCLLYRYLEIVWFWLSIFCNLSGGEILNQFQTGDTVCSCVVQMKAIHCWFWKRRCHSREPVGPSNTH